MMQIEDEIDTIISLCWMDVYLIFLQKNILLTCQLFWECRVGGLKCLANHKAMLYLGLP